MLPLRNLLIFIITLADRTIIINIKYLKRFNKKREADVTSISLLNRFLTCFFTSATQQ